MSSGSSQSSSQQAAVDPASVDPSTLTVGGVDAGLAARLKADPSAYATKKIEGLTQDMTRSSAGAVLAAEEADKVASHTTQSAQHIAEAVQTQQGAGCWEAPP